MTKRDENIIQTCFELARSVEPVSNARVCACVYSTKRKYTFGINKNKSSPFQALFSKNEHAIYFHAEISAIRNFIRYHGEQELEGSTIYVARARQDAKGGWEHGSAEPCKGCMRAIRHYGIRRIVYTGEGKEVHTIESVKQ